MFHTILHKAGITHQKYSSLDCSICMYCLYNNIIYNIMGMLYTRILMHSAGSNTLHMSHMYNYYNIAHNLEYKQHILSY